MLMMMGWKFRGRPSSRLLIRSSVGARQRQMAKMTMPGVQAAIAPAETTDTAPSLGSFDLGAPLDAAQQ
jgi:hypothetical protein